jgi:hypothetical protein
MFSGYHKNEKFLDYPCHRQVLKKKTPPWNLAIDSMNLRMFDILCTVTAYLELCMFQVQSSY